MQSYGSQHKGRAMMLRMIQAAITGQDADEFAEQELRRMRCQWCGDGWPVVNGQHDLLGVVMPCDAERGHSDE